MARDPMTGRPAMTVARLEAFSDAWDRANIGEVMSFFAEDCVFQPSIEESPNAAFRGRAAVAEEFRRIFARDKGYQGRSGIHVVFGRFGYCEWSLVRQEGGREIEIRGCDFFEFEGDLITRKDAFRKTTRWLNESG